MFPLSWRLTFGIQGFLLLVFHLLCAGGFNQSTQLLPEHGLLIYSF